MDSQRERSKEEQEELMAVWAKCPWPRNLPQYADWILEKTMEFDFKKKQTQEAGVQK
jgi:hypothetical protein